MNAQDFPGDGAGLGGIAKLQEQGVLWGVHWAACFKKTCFAFPPSPASWRSLGSFTAALPATISILSRIFANLFFQDALHAKPWISLYFVHPDKGSRRFPHFSKGFSPSNRRRHDGPSS